MHWIISLILLALAATPAAAGERPDILFLFADDQRADTIGSWGNKHIRTPNLDRLVKRGFSFRNNYCFGANSGAVCVPSRAMLLSGRRWFDVKADLTGARLLPEVLRDAGYVTFAAGKWHNGRESLGRAFPEARSMFLGGMDDHTKVPVLDVNAGRLSAPRLAQKFSSTEFADAAIGFLQQERSEQPFFCYVAFTAPHDPRNPPPAYREMYYRKPPPVPKNFLPEHPFNNGFARNVRDENLGAYPRTPRVIQEQLCEYYGLITHLDEQVGRILDALEKSGRAKNTLIIYTADHGLALGSHGLLGKQSVYEHSMKSPLIVAGPGVPRGKSTDAFTYLLDLFPTICAATGAAPPAGLAGHDLAALWTGRQKSIRDSVFLPYTDTMRAVRDARWKLIVYPRINHQQLFDLRKDPGEMNNIAAQKPAEVERLTRLLREWQNRTGDKQSLATTNPMPAAIRYDDFERKPDQWQPPWIVEKYF
ncbi:MAG TPA: sulfatase-like hydrolase/transferase [Methylomirabilota bacterium]|nr:sulfatase-like hydrolase/transferase [Methylomirabilota bacterium]